MAKAAAEAAAFLFLKRSNVNACYKSWRVLIQLRYGDESANTTQTDMHSRF